VERLYTNIDIVDLKRVLHEVLDMVWENSVANGVFPGPLPVTKDTICYKVYRSKTQKLKLYASLQGGRHGIQVTSPSHGMTTDRQGTDKRGQFYLFTLQEAKDMFDLLVDNTYVQFGEQLWHPRCGIPMGISPACCIHCEHVLVVL
jgi:hypothetical protein